MKHLMTVSLLMALLFVMSSGSALADELLPVPPEFQTATINIDILCENSIQSDTVTFGHTVCECEGSCTSLDDVVACDTIETPITPNDVGKIIRWDEKSTHFAPIATRLTDGYESLVSYGYSLSGFPSCGIGNYESYYFGTWSMSNGIDLHGYTISSIETQFSEITIDQESEPPSTKVHLKGSVSYNRAVAPLGQFIDSGQRLGTAGSARVELADLDADGDLDAIVANGALGTTDHANEVWLNNGDGYFFRTEQLLVNPDNALSERLGAGDLDGDGDIDFMVGTYHYSKVWFNQGDGYFTDNGQTLQAYSSGDVQLEDIDLDNDLDAYLVGGASPNKFEIWTNDGAGNFQRKAEYFPFIPAALARFGDFDGDSDPDLAVTAPLHGDSTQVWLQMWLNDGAGDFSLSTMQQTGYLLPTDIDTGDLDGDGDLDVVFSLGGCNETRCSYIWLNDGHGNLSESDQYFDRAYGWSAEVADLDKDGDLDIFLDGLYQSGTFRNRIYLNNGRGIFADSGLDVGESRLSDVKAGDLDKDGDLDLFFARFDDGLSLRPNEVWFQIQPSSTKPTITIVKDSRPESPRNFRFYGPFGDFRLDDPGMDDVDGINDRIRYEVVPGNYSFSEVQVTGWRLTDILCDRPELATINLAQRSVALNVGNGDNVTCTFVNQQSVTVYARAYWDKNASRFYDVGEPWKGGIWTEIYDSTGKRIVANFTNDDGQVGAFNLVPGTYSLCQTPPNGWWNTQPGQLDPRFNKPCYTFTMTAGGLVTGYFGWIDRPVAFAAGDDDAPLRSGLEIVPFVDSEENEDRSNIYLPVISR